MIPEPDSYHDRSRRPGASGVHDEVDEVARGLSRERAGRQRRRTVVLAVLAVLVTTLWFTRSQWQPLVTSSNPFTGTPAESFPVGEAGFTVPPAGPVPGMSRDAVAAALDNVHQALIGSYLDPLLLVQHDPRTVLGLLAPDSADAVRTRLTQRGYGTTLIRLAPGASPAAAPRVSGHVDYREVDWDGRQALDVTSNYVIAYAFPGGADPVVVHAETHWMFPIGGSLRESSRGMYLGRTSGYWHGMDCAAAARGLTAPVPAHDAAAKPEYQDPDPVDAYFDGSRSLAIASGCR